MNPVSVIADFKPIKTMNPRPVSRGWLRPAVCLALTAVAFALGSARTLAQATPNPPERMTYQGFLVDGNGLALGNSAPKNYDVIFRIFNDQNAGSMLWAEQQTVTVDKGYFSVLLGEGASTGEPRPGLATLFNGPTASDRFVGITVKGIGAGGANVDISPRLRLLTSPYAFLAQQAVKIVRSDTGNDLLTSSGNAITIGGPVTATSVSGDGTGLTGVAKLNGGNTFSGNQAFNNGVQLNSSVQIAGNNTLEFGAGLSKEGSAGKIGYGTFTPDALNIVGAGSNGFNRKLQVYAEGGANFTGPVAATAFVGNGTIPLGGIIMWSGSVAAIPSGWRLCDGGSSFGQTAPDLRNRFVIGVGASYNPGNTGGNANITLSVAQLPPHNHTFDDYYFAEKRGFGQNRIGSSSTDSDNDLYSVRNQTDYTGSGASIDIRPPYYALAFIMRVQ
jgi:hypothetical protein